MVSIDTTTVVVVGTVVVAACVAYYVLNQKKSTTTQTTKSKNKRKSDKKTDKKNDKDTINHASVSVIESKNQKKNKNKKATSAYETSKAYENKPVDVVSAPSKASELKSKPKPRPIPVIYSDEEDEDVEPVKEQQPVVQQTKQVSKQALKEEPKEAPKEVTPVLDEKDEEIRRLKEQLAALKVSSQPTESQTSTRKTQSKKKSTEVTPTIISAPTSDSNSPVTTTTSVSTQHFTPSTDVTATDSENESEWIEIKKKKKKKTQKAPDSDFESQSTKSDFKLKEIIMIPAEKRGIVMGRNAETLKKLISETGAAITVPKAEAKSNEGSIEGTPEQIKAARTAIKQLMEKGYASLFDPELSDGVVSVPVEKRSLVLGNSGANLRKIIDATGCKVNFPERTSSSEKVQVVGNPEAVREAVKTIKALVEDGFSPITHQGWVKVDIAFPAKYRRRLIGASGHLIKSIQSNSGCRINIPPGIEDVVYVIGPVENIALAEKQLNRLVAKIETPIEDVYESGFGDEDIEEEEEW